MVEKAIAYHAFLLRLWPVDVNGRVRWRASLQDVATGERRGFDGLEPLLAFLREETERWAAGGVVTPVPARE